MSVDKAKTVVETGKVVFDIVTAIIDRSEKRKAEQRRIAELQAEVARLKAEKP